MRTVAEFAVVVVLDDVAVRRRVGPVEQLGALHGGHGHAHGKLVRGRDVGHARVAPFQFGYGNARVPHRYETETATAVAHAVPGDRVAGILQRKHGLRVEELDQQLQQVLRARAHHDLLCAAAHAPILLQKRGQCAAQGRLPLTVAALKQLRGIVDDLLVQLGPGCVGKCGGVHHRGGEVHPGFFDRSPVNRRGRWHSRRDIGDEIGHIEAALGHGLHVALRHQDGVAVLHGGATDPEVSAQAALGGQLRAGREPPGLNLLRKIAVKLLIHGNPAAAVQGQGDVVHAPASNLTT